MATGTQGVIIVVNPVISSFSTSAVDALFRLAPWAVPVTATVGEATRRLAELPVSALMAADPTTGAVHAMLTAEPAVAAIGERKKSRKFIADQWEACFAACNAACADRGGCGGFALVTTPTGMACDHWCRDGDAGTDGPAIQDYLHE